MSIVEIPLREDGVDRNGFRIDSEVLQNAMKDFADKCNGKIPIYFEETDECAGFIENVKFEKDSVVGEAKFINDLDPRLAVSLASPDKDLQSIVVDKMDFITVDVT